jgi:DNA primase
MAFPSAWLDELFAKNEIVSVISSYVDLKPKGRKLWACCPLHGEKTPSFSVSPDKQLFYCFGCHAGGTVVQFVMDMERLTYPEAIRYLADRVGMEMPENVNDQALKLARQHKNRLYEATRAAARYYFECFTDPELGKPGREYAQKRGLTPEIVKRFGLGYAPESWDGLFNRLTKDGFTKKELLDAGLLVHNEQKNSVYDAYRGRMIYPIIGVNGQVLGFGARVLNNDKPKYINTGDTPIYNKRNNLYGLYLHKNEKLSDLIMVEGYMDVIGLYKAGVTNAVASLGTALTQQQARLLKRYVDTVYIAYDGDAAGQNATVRGLDILSAEGLQVRVISFPDDLDPDEYVQIYGKTGFDRLKENALSLNEFKVRSLANGFRLNDENDRERYAVRACAFVATLQPIEQERYYKVISELTGYAVEALEAQGARSGGMVLSEQPVSLRRGGFRRRNDSPEQPRFIQERTLLAACITDSEALKVAIDAGAGTLFLTEAFRTFFEALIQDPKLSIPQYVSAIPSEDAEAISSLLKEEGVMKNAIRTAKDCIRRLQEADGQASLEELQKRLAEPGLSASEKAELLQKIQTQIKAKK